MKRLREEEGSAFLMVIFMILLFMMLGMAVLSASIGGAHRTEKSEDNVQSLHLAEKALNEAAAHIAAEYNGKEMAIRPAELMAELQNFVKEFNNRSVGTGLEGASGYIESIVYTGNDLQAGQQKLDYYLKVTAKAEVNGSVRRLSQNIVLDTFPDFLRYGLGSEEGDVILNGSPYLAGNLYVGEELKLSSMAGYRYLGQELAVQSQFPYLAQQEGLYGEVYVSAVDRIKHREDRVSSYVPLSDPAHITRYLHSEPSRIKLKDNKKFVSINVEQSFLDKAALTVGDNPNVRSQLAARFKRGVKKQDDMLSVLNERFKEDVSGDGLPDGEGWLTPPVMPELAELTLEDEERYAAEVRDFAAKLGGLTKPVIVEGPLTLGDDYKRIYYTDKSAENWLIVNGDLIVENYEDQFVTIRGNILVTGDIIIKGKLAVDATVIGLGRTEVVDAQIRGIGGKELMVLISKGPVDVYRFDAFQPITGDYSKEHDYTLDAFFYTDAEAELYGVGSTFWMNGGFFARGDITINAVLGSTKAVEGETSLQFDARSQLAIPGEQSRFVIDYDQNVFTSQSTGLPRVKKVKVSIGRKWLESQ
ncbi:hypothetical protein DNH61_24195 [Paenibacillus sambharensis]|uniref:Uncharacterized protein n=1 Tax=Paenibacillus sambharensis TaxID=1803190 RepID=A0A2W1L276_9BACL|nr:hypothetical protein [Paenibacillus sambharensis]PZD93153.1 hypothetical protein DNH61_24195 [Paenibacillus sambharensis]